MGSKTEIQWTDSTWSPITGCSKVSAGCKHCYAETLAERFRGTKGHYFENGFDITLRPEMLAIPLRWKKPRRIFVNSMSDLFHESIPFEHIDKVFAVMAMASQHTFQVLTKRPERMLEYLLQIQSEGNRDRWADEGVGITEDPADYALINGRGWPLSNVWLGVSVENQKAVDERIPLLQKAPAAVRFISAEPLLEKLDLYRGGFNFLERLKSPSGNWYERIDWVICGGESGPGARQMHPDWARSLRDQCQAWNVPFLFKQWGERANETVPGTTVEMADLKPNQAVAWGDGKTNHVRYTRVGKHAAGRLLDGREWNEFPGAAP